MEELGLVHGNTVLDLRARFPSIDGATEVLGEIVIRVDGTDVWRCPMNHAWLQQLLRIRLQILISNAFLHLRPYHQPADVEFWRSWTIYFALTASTHAAEHGTGLELIAEIQTVLSPSSVQLQPEFVDGVLILTSDDVAPAATGISVEEELEMVRYDDGFSERACPICLEDFNMGMEVAKMPCSHFFHNHCIGRWLERSFLCPLCRSSVLSKNIP